MQRKENEQLSAGPAWPCRAMLRDASMSRLDPRRGSPGHVTGQRLGRRHVIPLAAPPCMARHKRFAAPGK